MILPMSGDESTGWNPGKPTEFLGGSGQQYAPAFSPDGRWLAYTSTESTQDEVYVRRPDGQRFAVLKTPDFSAETKLDTVTLIFNFFDELRQIAPPDP